MIVERNEFHLKFGKAKEAKEIWTKILDEFKKEKDHPPVRLLTDLTGPAYTLILEVHVKSFIDVGFKNYKWLTNDAVGKLYQEFVPLCESSYRTMYNIECEI